MGNSIKDALLSIIKKAGNFLSSSKSSTQKKKGASQGRDYSPAKNNPSYDPVCSDDGDLQFAQLMQKEGVEPVKFKNKASSKPSIAVTNQEANTSLPGLITKKGEKVSSLNPASRRHQRSQPETAAERPVSIAKSQEKIINTKQKRTTSISPSAVAPTKHSYKITVKDPVSPHPALVTISHFKKQLVPSSDGVAEQIADSHFDDEREVVIGLDFGTASVKVVVGDSVLGKAFAVPFFREVGLASFLLPSRVWLDDEGYSLMETGNPLCNLKLKLIKESCSLKSFSDSAAFLALVIRHARGWLFSENADIYRRTRILWKLTLGLPAESYNNKNLVERFKKLAAASWWLSRAREMAIPQRLVDDICTQVWQKQFHETHSRPELNHIDFDVVPELSAQIYGFLTSTKFDPKAENIFLMVDVGAGTIDSSVFHVKKGRGNKLSFDFYTNFVEFNGVANLHAERIKWLRSAFLNNDISYDLYKDLDMMEVPTDILVGIPENINDYFDGLDFSFDTDELCPDIIFFKQRVKKQVLGKTVLRARDRIGSEHDFADMPIFLCGGGSRMKFYKKLEKELIYHPNASWFHFKPRKLEVPEILIAPGVVKEDFDRLSVAFGLSFLQVGEFIRGRPLGKNKPKGNGKKRCDGCGAVGTCYCD